MSCSTIVCNNINSNNNNIINNNNNLLIIILLLLLLILFVKRTVDYQCENTIDVFNNSPATHIINKSNNFHEFKSCRDFMNHFFPFGPPVYHDTNVHVAG